MIIAGMDGYRFYVPGLMEGVGAGEGRVELPEEEGHHARGVLRMAGGERVVLFDGEGHWVAGKVAMGKGRRVVVDVQGVMESDLVPGVRLTVAAAVPKGDRAQWLVEQASQLYVWQLQWLMTDRGVVKPKEGGQKMNKWRRLAVESAKQCGRNFVMTVEEPVGVEEVLRGAGGKTILWLDPHGGRGVGEVVGAIETGEVVALVGPEGEGVSGSGGGWRRGLLRGRWCGCG